MAVPVVESVSTHFDTSTETTHTIAKPTGTVEGDLLIHLVSFDADDDPAFPTGFTELYDQTTGGPSAPTRIGAAWKIAGASEPANYTYGSTPTLAADGMLRISGHDGTTPIDVSSSTNGGADNTAVCPSVTTTNDNALIIRHVGTRFGRAPSFASATEQFNENGSNHAGAGGTESQVTAGATGTENATFGGGTSHWATATIAINEDQSGGLSIPVAMHSYRRRHCF